MQMEEERINMVIQLVDNYNHIRNDLNRINTYEINNSIILINIKKKNLKYNISIGLNFMIYY